MILSAFGDVHWKDGIGRLRDARERLGQTDLALLAGDITDNNNLDGYGEVIGAIKEMSDADIVAVFGNEEYDTSHLDYRSRFRITFLEEEVKDFIVEGVKLRIVGSTGSLDRPTWWQRNNVPDIWRRYKERVNKVGSILERGDADVLILLTHYATTYATLEGEKEHAFAEMGSNLFEQVVLEKHPDLVIHAHAHNGKRHALLAKKQRSLENFKSIDADVPVYNVSIPANHGPTFFEVEGGDDGVRIRCLQ